VASFVGDSIRINVAIHKISLFYQRFSGTIPEIIIEMLDLMQKTLDHTSRLLSSTKEELKQAHYNIKEKDIIISKQINDGNHWLQYIKLQ
jgi:hypothetical protein